MEFYFDDLRVIKPYMEELKESDPARYKRIVDKYNVIFKDLEPNSGRGPAMLPFLKDIFCND